MSNPEDYLVGCICATATEYVAAQAFLDETHDDPTYLPSLNKTNYTLGRIGEHNVVIASLVMGEYGASESSAARVAEDMIISFPNIRLSLMIGTGGGAPGRRNDIRLGDIVVGAPSYSRGTVIQYDFAKTMQSQKFEATGILNAPPPILGAAVAGLKDQYECDGHQLDYMVSKALAKDPQLREKYKRPDLASDRLYRSHVVNPQNGEMPCPSVCDHDPSCLISRYPRTEYDDNPAIHYGLIASANQLMKDALIRDKLAAQGDIICFEMDAAGLKNDFPCLAIRGICDYADSHQKREWQGYAAMVAAAYAKDLLYRITLESVKKEAKIVDVLEDQKQYSYNMSAGDQNYGLQLGVNNGRVITSDPVYISHETGPSNSHFIVSPNIQGRPPVSAGTPKQGSVG